MAVIDIVVIAILLVFTIIGMVKGLLNTLPMSSRISCTRPKLSPRSTSASVPVCMTRSHGSTAPMRRLIVSASLRRTR